MHREQLSWGEQDIIEEGLAPGQAALESFAQGNDAHRIHVSLKQGIGGLGGGVGNKGDFFGQNFCFFDKVEHGGNHTFGHALFCIVRGGHTGLADYREILYVYGNGMRKSASNIYSYLYLSHGQLIKNT